MHTRDAIGDGRSATELIVGGDAVYNGIHPYLGETDPPSRLEWSSTLDKARGPETESRGRRAQKCRKTTMIPASLPRRGNTFAIFEPPERSNCERALSLYDAMLETLSRPR